MLKRLALALFNLVGGAALGIVLLEGAFRANPALLLRGMDLPVPVDPPLTARAYDVHYSDADEIYWRPDLIRPIPPADNALEARVVFQTIVILIALRTVNGGGALPFIYGRF